MALKVNGVDITEVVLNGVQQKTLRYNGTAYFGKRYALTQNSSVGVIWTLTRTSSPNQGAPTGEITAGQPIYYGDEITISVAAAVNYTDPKLYVDTGSGMSLQSSSYSFTVTDNVVFYGTATAVSAAQWRTLWSGTKTFTASGVMNISALGGFSEVEVTADAEYEDFYLDSSFRNRYDGNRYTDGCYRKNLPVTLIGSASTINISRNGDELKIEFNSVFGEAKGYYICEQPISLTITEVRVK